MNDVPPAVALICPGPSLPDFWSEDLGREYDAVIAVNVAAHHFSCDYVGGVDRHIMLPIINGEFPAPRRGFLTHKTWINKIKTKPSLAMLETVLPGPYHGKDVTKDMERQMKTDRCGYTMPNALHFTRGFAKTQEIHIFGFDAAIDQDDISGGPGDRKWNRWFNELRWLKEYWHKDLQVFSRIDPVLLTWLADGSKIDDDHPPPLPDKHK